MKLNGKLLRQVRRAVNMSQHELAAKTGLTPQYISLVEAGYRALPDATAQKIRDALPVTDEEISMLAAVFERIKTG